MTPMDDYGVLWWDYDRYSPPELVGLFSSMQSVSDWLYSEYLPEVYKNCTDVGIKEIPETNGYITITVIRKLSTFKKIETKFTFQKLPINKAVVKVS